MDKKKAFSKHVKRPNVQRAPMPLDGHLKGGERRFRVSALKRIHGRCAGGGCPNAVASRNRAHEPFCPHRREITAGTSYHNPITGPRAKGIKAMGAIPTIVVVVADDEEEDREPRATECYPLASEAPVARASVARASVARASVALAPEVARAEAPSTAPRTPCPQERVLLQVIIYSFIYNFDKART
jgi:hypothetical protein